MSIWGGGGEIPGPPLYVKPCCVYINPAVYTFTYICIPLEAEASSAANSSSGGVVSKYGKTADLYNMTDHTLTSTG